MEQLKRFSYHLYLTFICLVWLIIFPADPHIDYIELIIHGLLVTGVAFGYFFVKKLKIKFLNLGWHLFSFSLLTAFLEEYTVAPYFIDILVEGLLGIAGIMVTSMGIYLIVKKYEENERELKVQKAYLEQLFANSPNAIVLLDNNDRVLQVNKGFEELFQYTQQEVEQRYLTDLIVPSGQGEDAATISENVLSGKAIKCESKRLKKDGSKVDVEIIGYPIYLSDERLGIYGIYQDITDRKKREDEIRYLSYHDPLTGVYNRRYFEKELERMDNSGKIPISLIMADVDDLKQINDTLGHKVGDKLIQETARIIRNVTRKTDVLARVGGDEFAIILPDTDERTAARVCKRIVKECRMNRRMPIKISIGYSARKSFDMKLEEIFIEADANMYNHKKQKKSNAG